MRRLLSPIFFFLLVLPVFFFHIVLPAHPSIIVFFAGFTAFFLLALLFGVLDVVAKVAGDPDIHAFQKSILKLVETSPFLFPGLLFGILLLAATLTSSPNGMEMMVYFLSFFLFCSAVYFVEMILVRNALRRYYASRDRVDKEDMQNLRAKPFIEGGGDSKKTLLLINPENQSIRGYSYANNSKFQPLGLGIVAALTTDDFHVKLIDENMEAFHYEAAEPRWNNRLHFFCDPGL